MPRNFTVFSRCLYSDDLLSNDLMQEEPVRANLRISVGVFVVGSNFLLIFGLLKSRRRSSPISRPNKLMILLSCNDLLIGFLNLVPIGKMTSNENDLVCYLKMFYDACCSFGLTFGMEIFFDIALLRCVSVVRPFYRISSKVLLLVLLVEAIISFNNFIFIYLIYFEKVSETHIGWVEIGNAVHKISMVVLISATTFIAYCHMRTTSSERNNLQDTHSQSRRNKRSAINTLLIITLCYAMCFIPLSAMRMNNGYKLLSAHRRGDFLETLEMINNVEYITLVLLAFSNSGINSFIFLVRSKETTAYYKSLAHKLFVKK